MTALERALIGEVRESCRIPEIVKAVRREGYSGDQIERSALKRQLTGSIKTARPAPPYELASARGRITSAIALAGAASGLAGRQTGDRARCESGRDRPWMGHAAIPALDRG
jgi:hypothetical protein